MILIDNTEQTNLELTRIKALCEQYGLSDLVTFLGKRSQDSLPYYYSAAEAVVVPSQYESFGMVALEAMACGKPVVASQIGGLAFLVKDGITGFSVPVDDPDELASRLTSLLADSNLREEMGNQAVLAAQEYSWERITSKLMGLYEEILRNTTSNQTGRLATT